VGHTDPVGDDAYNDALGLHRAEAVRTALRDALRKAGVADADVTITVETRGKRDLLPGDPALSRRVEVIPPHPFTPAAAAADIAFVLDDDDDKIVDEHAKVATFVRFGLWNHAYETTHPGHVHDVRNGQAEVDNFIGSDRRRFYIRVRDPAATTQRITANWKTLKSDRSDDDAPASMAITLTETRAGSHVYVSKAIMLVTDDTDANQDTHSGLTPPLIDAGIRHRGQSNHRLRRARMDGSVFAEYAPASGTAVNVTLPAFLRTPTDERRRVKVRVINYTSAVAGYKEATAGYIRDQFEHANRRWNQIGLQIDPQTTTLRPLPPGLLGPDGRYAVEDPPGPRESALLNDLIDITPDNTVTVAFMQISLANAFTTIYEAAPPPTAKPLQNRFYMFVDPALDLDDETLAHELAHVLFNRFDAATEPQFFTLNTTAPHLFGTPLPDPRVYRRIQDLNSPDPDNDPHNDNIVNWARRVRTGRFPVPAGGLGAATATTGNTLTEAF
jgi:hypothetical protein